MEVEISQSFNGNIHGHSQSVQLYATSAAISGMKFGLESHIASSMNVVTQIFHYRATPGMEAFLTYSFWGRFAE